MKLPPANEATASVIGRISCLCAQRRRLRPGFGKVGRSGGGRKGTEGGAGEPPSTGEDEKPRTVSRRGRRLLSVKLREESQVLARCRLREQMRRRRVHSCHPPVLVLPERRRIIDVHLDQVLVEAVVAAVPAALTVQKGAVLGAHVRAHQAGPRLRSPCRAEQVVLGPLRELRIRLVSGEVAETRPFENKGANLCDVVGRCAAVLLHRVEVDGAVGHAAGRVKGHAETVGECLRLLEERFDFLRVGPQVLVRPLEQIIAWFVSERGRGGRSDAEKGGASPERRPPRYRMLVSKREIP